MLVETKQNVLFSDRACSKTFTPRSFDLTWTESPLLRSPLSPPDTFPHFRIQTHTHSPSGTATMTRKKKASSIFSPFSPFSSPLLLFDAQLLIAMPSKRTSPRHKLQQLSATEDTPSTEPWTPTPSIDTSTTACTSCASSGIDVTRLPRHFQQPEEDWGDLDKYIQSRPIANSKTHFSQLKSYLDQIIADGNNVQRRVATDMKNSITVRLSTCLPRFSSPSDSFLG